MSPHAYTEVPLVEQPAIELLTKGAGNRTYDVPGQVFVARSRAGQAPGDASNPHHPSADTHHPLPDTHQPLPALPPDLRARIPDPGTKPRKETLRALIRDLCAWRALRAWDIAELLGGRDQKHLVREFLSPTAHERLLAYTIPSMENHPDQRHTLCKAAPGVR